MFRAIPMILTSLAAGSATVVDFKGSDFGRDIVLSVCAGTRHTRDQLPAAHRLALSSGVCHSPVIPAGGGTPPRPPADRGKLGVRFLGELPADHLVGQQTVDPWRQGCGDFDEVAFLAMWCVRLDWCRGVDCGFMSFRIATVGQLAPACARSRRCLCAHTVRVPSTASAGHGPTPAPCQ